MPKGKFVQKKKGAAKLRRPARVAAGVKRDKYGIQSRSNGVFLRKVAHIQRSNGGAAKVFYVVAIARRREKSALAPRHIEFPAETPETRWATAS